MAVEDNKLYNIIIIWCHIIVTLQAMFCTAY